MKFLKYTMQPNMDAHDDSGGDAEDFSDAELDTGIEADDSTDTTKTDDTVKTDDTAKDTVKEDTKPDETVSQKVKLKYNHEEKEYSLDDVVPLAQKGLNYDKLQEKFDEIQKNPALTKYSKVEEISKLLGYQTDDEMLDDLYKTYYERTAETQGLTPQQIQKDYELSQKEKVVATKETSIAQKQKDTEMYTNFAVNFPDVKAEMISQDTWGKVNSGMDLSSAYTMQQNQELKSKLKILEQNADNSTKAPIGGVSTHGSDTSKHDPFVDGFDEV